jgi:hypothetical protein
MRRSRGRAYVALYFVSALAAMLLGASAVLQGALWRGHRDRVVRERHAAARLVVEGALLQAVAECRVAGRGWTPPAETADVTIAATPAGFGWRVTVVAADAAAPIRRRIAIFVDDARPSGDRVTGVVPGR